MNNPVYRPARRGPVRANTERRARSGIDVGHVSGLPLCRPARTIVLDRDASESPTYGEQEGSAYNGHFGCACYHPVFVFNQLGDVERCALRPGNVHALTAGA